MPQLYLKMLIVLKCLCYITSYLKSTGETDNQTHTY